MKHIYCIEILFEGMHPEIIGKIKDLGDEIILIPISEYTKLHIHTEDYQKVLNAVKEYNILKQKIDDNLV